MNLWRHVRTQHTAQQPQECTYCQKNFKNKYSLREHIRIAHEKQTTGAVAGAGSGNSGASGVKVGGTSGNSNDELLGTTDADIVILKAEK